MWVCKPAYAFHTDCLPNGQPVTNKPYTITRQQDTINLSTKRTKLKQKHKCFNLSTETIDVVPVVPVVMKTSSSRGDKNQ